LVNHFGSPQQPGPNKWLIAAIGCGGCGCLGVIGVIVATYFGVNYFNETAKQAQRDLKVQSHELIVENGKRFIVGTCKNISANTTYQQAEVDFELFDKAGATLGTAEGTTEELVKAGTTWNFKAPVTDSAVTSYRFDTVYGYPYGSDEENIEAHAQKQRARTLHQKTKADLQKAKAKGSTYKTN